MSQGSMGLAANLELVRENIVQAARAAGREPEDITLVAVTKGVAPEAVATVMGLGVSDLGENRVQEARKKIPLLSSLCPGRLRFHLIGHLQRNKVKYALDFHFIHSVDSLELAELISRVWVDNGRVARLLVQVNMTGEPAKSGFSPALVKEALVRMAELPGLRLEGLMTIGRQGAGLEETRGYFRGLRRLRDACQGTGMELEHLSMGMSDDYRIAVEEGATILRIGRAIFGDRLGRQG